MNIILYSLFLLLWIFPTLRSIPHERPKVLIFTYSYNQTEFIDWQYHTFKKFIKDDYEYIVFNDAPNEIMCKKIENKCKEYGIKCIRMPQEIHNRPTTKKHWTSTASRRNCDVVQYSLETMGFDHDGIVMLCDSDIFAIKEFSIVDYLHGYDIATSVRSCHLFHKCPSPKHFFWIGLVMLDMRNIQNKRTLDFDCGYAGDCPVDSGGFTYFYVKNNPQAKIRYFDRVTLWDLMCGACRNKVDKAINFATDHAPINLPPCGGCVHDIGMLKKRNFADTTVNFIRDLPIYKPHVGRLDFYVEDVFLHYCEGTNYTKYSQQVYDFKLDAFRKFIHSLLNQTVCTY